MEIDNYFKDTVEENMSQKFRFKNINEKKKLFPCRIEENELTNRKHKKVCTTLNISYLAFSLTGCISISSFASLLGIAIGIKSS